MVTLSGKKEVVIDQDWTQMIKEYYYFWANNGKGSLNENGGQR